MRTKSWRYRRLAALVLAGSLTLAACSSSGSGSGGGGSASTSSGTASDNAQVARASALTKQYTAEPSPFPVTTPLPRALPAGTTFGWLQCVSSVCAAATPVLQTAMSTIGGRLVVAKAGASAQEEQAAFSSLLQQKPAAILLPAIASQEVAPQINQAHAAGIPLVSVGQMDATAAGISANSFGNAESSLAGKLLADYVVARDATSNVVFYETSELSFVSVEQVAFKAELSAVCPGCQLRTVNIPIAAYGTSAPQRVVSDLEAHSSTSLMVFGACAAASGLVAALKTASLSTPFIGFSLPPDSLQNIKQGNQLAGLSQDFPIELWTIVDEAARLVLKAPLPTGEQQQNAVLQWLDKSNISGVNVSELWTGYPDYASRFRKLWAVS